MPLYGEAAGLRGDASAGQEEGGDDIVRRADLLTLLKVRVGVFLRFEGVRGMSSLNSDERENYHSSSPFLQTHLGHLLWGDYRGYASGGQTACR